MKKFKVKIHLEKIVEAEDIDMAEWKFFEEIESIPQETFETYICKFMRVEEVRDGRPPRKMCAEHFTPVALFPYVCW